MRVRTLFLNIAAAAGLCGMAGCSPPPPLNFALQHVAPSQVKVDADLRAVTVVLAQPTDRTGPLPMDSNAALQPWKEALTDALDRTALFDDNSLRHVSLAVKVLKVDIPIAGITLPTDVDAKYDIIDRRSGQSIFSQVISSTGSTEMEYSLIAAIRVRESINRAVEGNIAKFIETLERSELTHLPQAAKSAHPSS